MSEAEERFIDGTSPVRDGEELDPETLGAYLVGERLLPPGPVTIEQFPKGHSNLTYLVRAGDRELVLRRPPFGSTVKTAHDMGREFRILSGLIDTFGRVPRPLVYCEDEGVIDAPFYVMERVRGLILRGQKPPAGLRLDTGDMRALSAALVDELAALHAVDVAAAGLADYGKPEGYVERQVSGWTERYANARTDTIREVEETAVWLAENLPDDAGAALIHNDYKYDNLVLDPADPTRIVAVLDWEMATVGDPLMDLGTSLGYWLDPADLDETRMLPFGPTQLEGNLTRALVVDRYARRSGRDVSDALFYYVYGLFKIVGIAQQIYKRFHDGLTKDQRFAMMIMGVQILGKQAIRAIERGRYYDLR